MTKRGLIYCNWYDQENQEQDIECKERAIWWDEAPLHSATCSEFWCNDHCPEEVPKGFERFYFRQDLVQLEDGGEIWYPSFLINGEWRG